MMAAELVQLRQIINKRLSIYRRGRKFFEFIVKALPVIDLERAPGC